MKFVLQPLSAGRVQSAAVKLIVDRDRLSIRSRSATTPKATSSFKKFSSQNYFTCNQRGQFAQVMTLIQKQVLQTVLYNSLRPAESLLKELSCSWHVSCSRKAKNIKSKATFTTSTLQQEAASKLKSSLRQTMITAQKLYENGFITYMRTDSTNLSKKEAIKASRNIIKNSYKEYLPKKSK